MVYRASYIGLQDIAVLITVAKINRWPHSQAHSLSTSNKHNIRYCS